ncbi:MspA family porin [Nocardia sp. NEAU-G5]|uniref:MspA family porin n=2 Tax=Nocardiaceae TaxID=85025 RepID=A0ABS6AX06_9NOCA|nr:MspA family porin [Nocardia albiluteola]MBU3065583.1 MspA family porin [Nocardia albiluteola]
MPCIAAAALVAGAFGTASADPVADSSRAVVTDDGWQVRVTKAAENLDRVPNLAGSPFTREGFVRLEAIADISGKGRVPVDSGSMAVGYEIGCQVDVSNGLTVGLSAAIGPNVGISVGGVNAGASALAIPNVSFAPKPGTITTVPLATKKLTGAHASVTLDRIQIKIDACMGPVSLRSYAIVSTSTADADNSVAVYGNPIWL